MKSEVNRIFRSPNVSYEDQVGFAIRVVLALTEQSPDFTDWAHGWLTGEPYARATAMESTWTEEPESDAATAARAAEFAASILRDLEDGLPMSEEDRQVFITNNARTAVRLAISAVRGAQRDAKWAANNARDKLYESLDWAQTAADHVAGLTGKESPSEVRRWKNHLKEAPGIVKYWEEQAAQTADAYEELMSIDPDRVVAEQIAATLTR